MYSLSPLWKVKMRIIAALLPCLCSMPILQVVAQNDLFFSEYVIGSSNNKCIELFNPTDNAIVLDNVYRISIYFNGDTERKTLRNLEGVIPAKQAFVLCNGLTDIPRDLAFAAGPNGNDALVIEKSGIIIDIFGNIGCDPGTQWAAGNIGTKNSTLVRKSCIQKGVDQNPSACDFPTLATEWIAYPKDDVSHLGSHLYGDIVAEVSIKNETCLGLENGLSLIHI